MRILQEMERELRVISENFASKIKVRCVSCRKEFVKRTKKRKGGHRNVKIRGMNMITCSKKCSKIWNERNRLGVEKNGRSN